MAAGAAEGAISIIINYVDAACHAGALASNTTDGTNVSVDVTPPALLRSCLVALVGVSPANASLANHTSGALHVAEAGTQVRAPGLGS